MMEPRWGSEDGGKLAPRLSRQGSFFGVVGGEIVVVVVVIVGELFGEGIGAEEQDDADGKQESANDVAPDVRLNWVRVVAHLHLMVDNLKADFQRAKNHQ